SMSWTGGKIIGTTTIAAAAVLNITGPDDKTLDGELDNDGTIHCGAALPGRGTINNNGLFEIQTDAPILGEFGVPGDLNNSGTLRKTADATGTSELDAKVTNDGTIEVLAGTLVLGKLTNLSNFRLTGGQYVVRGTGVLQIPDDELTFNKAQILLDGPAARITN